MRIAVIAEVFLPKIDGVVMRTMRLLEQLSKAGDEVVVFCPEADHCEHPSIRTITSPSFPCVAYPEYQIGQPTANVIRQLKEFDADVIHFINPLAFGFQCYNLLQREQVSVPTVFSFHTLYGEFVRQYPVLRSLAIPIWSLTREYHNCADINLTVSSILHKDLESRGFQRVRTWPPAVDTELFRPERKNPAMRSLLSAGETDKPLLLTVSRLAPEKNVGFISKLVQQHPNVRLAIVGDGPDRSRLESMFPKETTTFTGYFQGERLAEAYASSDLFVYASETETMGNVIMEAMSSGLPVLAPRAGGIPSLMEHECSGLLFEPGSTSDANVWLQKLLDESFLRAHLKQQAREHVLRCQWEHSIGVVRSAYEEAILHFKTQPPSSHNKARRISWRSRLAVASLVHGFRGLAQAQTAGQRVRRRLAPAA